MMYDPLSQLTTRPVRGVLNILQEGIQTLFHLLLFSLLLLGFGGLIYKALRSGGWIESLLGSFWAQHPAMTIVTLLGAMGVAALAKRYFDNVAMFGKRGDVLVYGCLALGLFFAFKLVVTGTL
jgi:Na+/H+ antiporter NhaC